MKTDSERKAVEKWSRAIGSQHVITDVSVLQSYQNNVSGLSRKILTVIKPSSTEEVRNIVLIANECMTPLYPISCGKNWGFGSRLPVRDGAAILDLSRMNRIREVSVEHHYAIIDPGVTQKQLYDHLEDNHLPLMMNVTGAGASTSLLGNALERGIGYFSTRAECLSGLEIVLGNGKLLRTGYGHFSNAQATHLYKYGVGPSLDGLFSQSNYGIVTSAGIELFPKFENHVAMIAKIRHSRALSAFIDALAELRKQGVIQTVVHIANRNRLESTLSPLIYMHLEKTLGIERKELVHITRQILEKEELGEWSAVTGIMGSALQLRESQQKIRCALHGIAKVSFTSESSLRCAKWLCNKFGFLSSVRRKKSVLHAMEPLYGLTKGIPTDAALGSVYWPMGEIPAEWNPDQSRCGILFCVPVTPMNSRFAREVLGSTEETFKKHHFVPYITMNMINSKALQFVINVAFDREDSKQVQNAHMCIDELHEEFFKQGFIPYRMGIQWMSRLVSEDDSYWQTVRDLKQILDPNHIISPGHYNLV